jgi:hypothetical protein
VNHPVEGLCSKRHSVRSG